VAWLNNTAAQAEKTAALAKAAAAAYELAFAMTVPPAVIAANRSLFMALIATNFFGQNAPAIAATEAHYGEMWAQDATAMYGYAGSTATASHVDPFTEPPSTVNPPGPAAQSGGAITHAAGNTTQPVTLSQMLSAMPTTLQQLAAPTAPAPSVSSPTLLDVLERIPNAVNTVLSTTNAVTSGRSIFIQNARLAAQAANDTAFDPELGAGLATAAPSGTGGSAASTVSAGMGRATLTGSLSVPPNWATAAPETRPVAVTLTNSSVAPAGPAEMPPVPGSAFSQSVLGTLSRHESDGPRARSKPVITRSPAAG
jgi:PPE-repeat protein